eukprot:CAMPEP_0185157134 /NCGR_PEP_ID=MMETSP1139-20130426/1572_1 /TAXON_ID=298111 /ORGANISM="Pavlova sp., Strain CCMP459" /LENGTH=264 /DNA_ID=CAMNT_0027722191 /DNA_START=15 /DNA_END=807 /DNA_ORIENTATION=+
MAEFVKKSAEFKKKTDETTAVITQLTSVIELKKNRIAQLNAEIEADKLGLEAYGPKTIVAHRQRQEVCRGIIKECEEWIEFFDGAIGPFEKQYHDSQDAVRVKYDEAMLTYKKSIETLIREFGYNPAFKDGTTNSETLGDTHRSDAALKPLRLLACAALKPLRLLACGHNATAADSLDAIHDGVQAEVSRSPRKIYFVAGRVALLVLASPKSPTPSSPQSVRAGPLRIGPGRTAVRTQVLRRCHTYAVTAHATARRVELHDPGL